MQPPSRLVLDQQMQGMDVRPVDVARLVSKGELCCQAVGRLRNRRGSVPGTDGLRVNSLWIEDIGDDGQAVGHTCGRRKDRVRSRCYRRHVHGDVQLPLLC